MCRTPFWFPHIFHCRPPFAHALNVLQCVAGWCPRGLADEFLTMGSGFIAPFSDHPPPTPWKTRVPGCCLAALSRGTRGLRGVKGYQGAVLLGNLLTFRRILPFWFPPLFRWKVAVPPQPGRVRGFARGRGCASAPPLDSNLVDFPAVSQGQIFSPANGYPADPRPALTEPWADFLKGSGARP